MTPFNDDWADYRCNSDHILSKDVLHLLLVRCESTGLLKLSINSLPLLTKPGSISITFYFYVGVGGIKWVHAIMINHVLYCFIFLSVEWVEYTKQSDW